MQMGKKTRDRSEPRARGGGGFSRRDLGFADADCVRALRALRNLKRHLVSFSKLFERNVRELVAVEKEILFHAVALDEAITAIGLFGNSSFLHECKVFFLSNVSRTGFRPPSSTCALFARNCVDMFSLPYPLKKVKPPRGGDKNLGRRGALELARVDLCGKMYFGNHSR